MYYKNNKVARIWNKHSDEISAFFLRRYPSFVISRKTSKPLSQIPVFVFHEVNANDFEFQLKYLSENNYRSLNCKEFENAKLTGKREGNEVVLTFDDATSTFWTYAFPLLKKYNHKAILFAIAGLTPDDTQDYPNLEDLWSKKATLDQLSKRKIKQPLCTWSELSEMSNSSYVDVQCHSLTHSRVFTALQLTDFIHPKFDTYFYGNINIPIASDDNPINPNRLIKYGDIVFKNDSRMKCTRRFKENVNLSKYMRAYVKKNGDKEFFNNPKWRKELKNHYEKWDKNKLGEFETKEEMISAVHYEFITSKQILQERLNTQITHFCYPWFESSTLSDQIAGETGYEHLYYSMNIPYDYDKSIKSHMKHTRISEEYLLRLPGKGRVSYSSVWTKKIKNYIAH